VLKPLISAHLTAHVGADRPSLVFTTSLDDPASTNHVNGTLARAAAESADPTPRSTTGGTPVPLSPREPERRPRS